MQIFFSTLNQTTFLFALIALGYALTKFKFVPRNSPAVLSKLENYLFLPALVLLTFTENFTIEKISSTWKILLFSLVVLAVVIPVTFLITKFITKDDYIRKIYIYGLTFSNFAFMGNAIVSTLFPEIFLEYVIFTIALWIVIYLWGAPALLISDSGHMTLSHRLKSFVNPMFIAMVIGAVLGLLKLSLPSPIELALTSAKDCMSPVAMLLTGMTVANIDLKKTFSDVKIYIISILRLVIYPLIFILLAKFIPMDNTLFICTVCSLAMPLGLNTIVIPGAYGKDTSAAAGMALVSHLLSCITIPLIFNLI